MAGVKILTSDDIYIELNGNKIAGVESYSTRYTNDVRLVDAFGQGTAIGFTVGSKKYVIDLSRVYLEDTTISDGIDFYSLTELAWNLVVVKLGSDGVLRRTVFESCIISDISEDGALKGNVGEKISVMALNRRVEKV